MVKNPPAGLIQRPETFFRRKRRQFNFYLSTTFRLHAIQFSFCILIIAVFLMVMTTPLIKRFEYVFLDLFFRQRPPIAQHPAITYIDMAEDSLKFLGRWPWPRHNHAALIHVLKEWGAKTIVFDVVFSEKSSAFDDGAMVEALKKSDNVYLPLMVEGVADEKIWVRPISEFSELTKGTGHVNITPDDDGTLRRIEPWLESGSERHPYIAMQVAYDYLGEPIPEAKDYPFGTDEKGNLFINWAGKWKEAFTHYSFVDVIRSYGLIQQGEEPIVKPEDIKDKICIIGLTAFGLTYIKANPVEKAYPAVGVQANILNSILTGQYVRPVSGLTNSVVLIVLGVIATLLFIFSKTTYSFLIGLGCGGLWLGFSYFMFAKEGLWFYTINPLLLIFSLFIFSAIFSLTMGRKEQERLFTLATQDGLTGLYVIRHFRTLLNDAVTEAHKKKTPLSMVILDIDFFKKINDTYGHLAGDMALKGLAKTIQDVFKADGDKRGKEKNPVGRYGGEEFIGLMRNCSLVDAAFNFCEPLRKKVEQLEVVYEGKKIPLTISLGVATVHPEENVPDLMVHRADDALYRAKETGRNRTCLETDVKNGHPAPNEPKE